MYWSGEDPLDPRKKSDRNKSLDMQSQSQKGAGQIVGLITLNITHHSTRWRYDFVSPGALLKEETLGCKDRFDDL